MSSPAGTFLVWLEKGLCVGWGVVAALQAAGGQVRIAGWVCLEGHLGRGRFMQFSRNRDTQAPTGHRSRGAKSAGETSENRSCVNAPKAAAHRLP